MAGRPLRRMRRNGEIVRIWTGLDQASLARATHLLDAQMIMADVKDHAILLPEWQWDQLGVMAPVVLAEACRAVDPSSTWLGLMAKKADEELALQLTIATEVLCVFGRMRSGPDIIRHEGAFLLKSRDTGAPISQVIGEVASARDRICGRR